MAWLIRIALTATILMQSHNLALAFGTLNGFGQSAEHERITALALAPFGLDSWTLSELKGREHTFGAVGMPDNPTRGLMFKGAAHCDDGDWSDLLSYPQEQEAAAANLKACQTWIFENLSKAVEQSDLLLDREGRLAGILSDNPKACDFSTLSKSAKCNVLQSIGLAFHAAQDFYAHTNWTDVTTRDPVDLTNPPGLGNEHRAPWLDPRLDVVIPPGLISGCFSGVPEWVFCKNRVRHAVLNKDTGPINVVTGEIGAGTTSRGRANDNFARAVRAAIDDTRNKWAFYEEQIIAKYGKERGPTMICVMRRDRPSSCQQSRDESNRGGGKRTD